MLDFPEWHVENCKNKVMVYDGGFRCTDNLSCIHAYAEYRVMEATDDVMATIAGVHYHSLHQDPKDHIGVAAIFQTFADQCEEHIPELKRLRQPLPEYKEQQ